MTDKKASLTLEVRKLTVLEVSWSKFEDFIQKVYNKEYDFVADQECSNDSSHAFERITGKLDEYEESDLKKFVETGEYNNLASILLEDLCRKKLIERGNYLINVSW
ncbi:hypothetical protein HY837_06520 [archaeon]|nr:hypothetical protein [archaeon]